MKKEVIATVVLWLLWWIILGAMGQYNLWQSFLLAITIAFTAWMVFVAMK